MMSLVFPMSSSGMEFSTNEIGDLPHLDGTDIAVHSERPGPN